MSEPTHPTYLDGRDMKVVSEMDIDEVYGSRQVIRAYKHYTDINADRTAERRKNELFQSPCMELVKPGYFRFLGTDVESEGPL
jgi:hypothetical protein